MSIMNTSTLSHKTMWITTDKIGYVQEIKTRGPIVTPIEVPSRVVLKMVQNGRKVYEHNPKNKRQRVLLTIENFDKVKVWNEDGTVTITGKEKPKKCLLHLWKLKKIQKLRKFLLLNQL